MFRSDLRRAIIFGRHDLIQDAPISRLDLLICRNTLMYFNAEIQSQVLARMHFALRDTGFLFLGKAEMLITQARFFTPVSLDYRTFAKLPRSNPQERFFNLSPEGVRGMTARRECQELLVENAFESGIARPRSWSMTKARCFGLARKPGTCLA
jgi:two-component system, chemotaxis family, CheB/CheR fusion protein